MRGRRERRYLTEKYQSRQVRMAYETSYDRPYDPNRYIRTEFARKRRFFDLLCGNFTDLRTRWGTTWALGNQHTFTKAELGRLRKQSFANCGNARCCYCCNPRRGRFGDKELTKGEVLAELHIKEELDFYYKEKQNENVEKHSAKRYD